MLKFKLLFIILFAIKAAFAIVNINTADYEELQTLKGIGPTKAQAIIQYRNTNGNFQSIDDLKKISGFGDKTIAKLKPQVEI